MPSAHEIARRVVQSDVQRVYSSYNAIKCTSTLPGCRDRALYATVTGLGRRAAEVAMLLLLLLLLLYVVVDW